MPEGDTVHRIARVLRRELLEHTLDGIFVRDRGNVGELAGSRVTAIDALGKHLLVHLDRGWTLRVHLGMHGRWMRRNVRETLPHQATVILTAGETAYICERAYTAELLRTNAVRSHPRLRRLGPDLLAEPPDIDEAVRRASLPAYADREIGELLLDQRVAAGIGNVYKSEVLFECRIHPRTRTRDLPADRLRQLFERAAHLMRLNAPQYRSGVALHPPVKDFGSICDMAAPASTAARTLTAFCRETWAGARISVPAVSLTAARPAERSASGVANCDAHCSLGECACRTYLGWTPHAGPSHCFSFMSGTQLSSSGGNTGSTVRGDQPPADVLTAHARWQRELVLAADERDLVDVVRRTPPSLLPGCTLDLVPPVNAAAASSTPKTGASAVPVRCRGRVAGLLLVHVVDGTVAAGWEDRVASVVTSIETALENLERLSEARGADAVGTPHEAYFEQLFSAAPEAIVVLDSEDRVIRANHKFYEMFGYTQEEAVGSTINELIVPSDQQADALLLTRKVADGAQVVTEAIRRRRDGSTFCASILGTPIVVHGNQVAVYGIYRDITAQKTAEDALRRLSTTDELTGLFNRRGFFMLAEQQRKIAMRAGAELLLLYIDIDDFKNVNDRFGHLEGDRVLADLGRLLQHCYRNSDIVARVSDGTGLLARMGGDEFVVLAIDAGRDGEHILVSRLRERLQEYNDSRDAPYRISLSIGAVRVKPEPDSSIDTLLAAADRLMYRDKRDQPRG
jgi:endonuclease VIII